MDRDRAVDMITRDFCVVLLRERRGCQSWWSGCGPDRARRRPARQGYFRNPHWQRFRERLRCRRFHCHCRHRREDRTSLTAAMFALPLPWALTGTPLGSPKPPVCTLLGAIFSRVGVAELPRRYWWQQFWLTALGPGSIQQLGIEFWRGDKLRLGNLSHLDRMMHALRLPSLDGRRLNLESFFEDDRFRRGR